MSSRQSPVQGEEIPEESGVVESQTEEDKVNDTEENNEEKKEQPDDDGKQVENDDVDDEITVDESLSIFKIVESLTKEYEELKSTIESKNGEEISEDSMEVKKQVKRLKRELNRAIAYQSKLSENQNFVDDINATLQNLITKVKADNTQVEENNVEETEVAVKKAKSTKRLAEVAEELAQVQQLAAEYEQKVIDMEEKLTKVKNEAENAENAVENSKTEANASEEEEEKQKLEEEERQRREEEEKCQREEEERRLEEERKRLEEKKKEEEERRKKLDPVSWPMFKIEGDDKIINSGLVCMIRAQDGAYSDGQIKGEMVCEAATKYPLPCEEEIVSNVIRLYCDGEEPVKFSKPIAIAIPLSLPRALPAREFVIKVLNTSPYKDLLTRDIIYPEYKEIRFADALFDEVRDLTLCVVSRFKKEKETFNNKGGKLVSSIDSRVSLTIPKRSLRLATELSLQVQPIDSTAVGEAKTRYPKECDSLLGCSPKVCLKTYGSVPFPKGCVTMQCAGVKRDAQKSSGLPAVGNSYQAKKEGDLEEEGNVYLLYQNSKDEWFLASDLAATIDGDLYSINLDHSVQEYRLLLIRVKSNITATQVPKIANGLQRSLSRKTVKFILKQSSTESDAFLECCRSDRVDDVLLRLKQNGFTNGPSPSDDIVIKEGQALEVRFRGNVTGTVESISLVYNSHVNTSSSDVQVKVVDKFAQHGLDLYRGHVQLFEIVPAHLEEDPKKKKDQKQIKKKEEETEKGEIEFERKLLTQLVVSLPKEERNLERIKKAPYKMASFGILNEELFDEIAKELGDEWKIVALKLGISNARLQDMELMSSSKNDGNIVKDMLVRWFKGTNRSTDKVNVLYWALFEGGRDDLADMIFQRNSGDHNEEDSKPSSASELFDKKINKAFTKIVTNALINEEWKILSRKLTLTDNDLNCIEDKYNKNGTNKDKALEALFTWKKSKGPEATPSRLISALKDSGFSDMSVQVKGIFAS